MRISGDADILVGLLMNLYDSCNLMAQAHVFVLEMFVSAAKA
jgi:hypothetical protein